MYYLKSCSASLSQTGFCLPRSWVCQERLVPLSLLVGTRVEIMVRIWSVTDNFYHLHFVILIDK